MNQPKYIHQLMKAVEDRKKEQERREERKIQKERVAEGEKFSDKDAYVTSAYKQKLLEQKEEQEREDRQAQIEGWTDTLKSHYFLIAVRLLSPPSRHIHYDLLRVEMGDFMQIYVNHFFESCLVSQLLWT